MKTLVILRFLLPQTFPLSLVSENERRFMDHLIGMTLEEATANAAQRGLQPSVSPLPHVHPHAHHFCLTVNGLVTPWCAILGEPAARTVH